VEVIQQDEALASTTIIQDVTFELQARLLFFSTQLSEPRSGVGWGPLKTSFLQPGLFSNVSFGRALNWDAKLVDHGQG
jgi:hypothetical protein